MINIKSFICTAHMILLTSERVLVGLPSCVRTCAMQFINSSERIKNKSCHVTSPKGEARFALEVSQQIELIQRRDESGKTHRDCWHTDDVWRGSAVQCLYKSGSFFGQKNRQKTIKVLLINTQLTVRGTERENVQEKDRNLHICMYLFIHIR